MNYNTKVKIFYNIAISILALISIVIFYFDYANRLSPRLIFIDNIIYVFFVIDYMVRLIYSKTKKTFLKNNIFDLVAIIPFNQVFRFARFARLLKITKALKFIKVFALINRFLTRLSKLIKTNNFHYMLYTSLLLLFTSSVVISYIESLSFSDALWWSFVTITTVGYGDLSPVTQIGKIVASVLMIFGIGLIGSLTSAITSYFFDSNKSNSTFKDDTISNIKNSLNNFDELTEKDVDDICSILKTLKKG